jgi:hypothetical protein
MNLAPEHNPLEYALARVFGTGLSLAMLLLLIGLLWRPALWAGIAALALVPPVGAVLAWHSASRETKIAILVSSLGVVVATVIGLLLRR